MNVETPPVSCGTVLVRQAAMAESCMVFLPGRNWRPASYRAKYTVAGVPPKSAHFIETRTSHSSPRGISCSVTAWSAGKSTDMAAPSPGCEEPCSSSGE